MSWKSLVTASLLCALASPAFAVDPVLGVAKGGTFATNYLNANGDWVWNVQVSNSNPIPTGSSPLGVELGFTTSTALKGATNLSTLDSGIGFDKSNPGKPIFGWENLGVNTNNFPEGLQSNCAAGCSENTPGDDPNTVFASLGSQDFNTVGPHNYIQIITRGPSAGAGGVLASSLQVSGAYSGKGRISEATGVSTSVNFDTYNNLFTRTAVPGDANLNGVTDGGDLNILLSNFGAVLGKTWANANFNNHIDGVVDGGDLNILLSNFNAAGSIGNGAGIGPELSGGNSSVPEPASIALLGLGLLGALGIVRRKR